MAFPPFCDIEEMDDHIKETSKWHLRRASCPPRAFLKDYQGLCLSFTLPDTEEATCDFNILEIV